MRQYRPSLRHNWRHGMETMVLETSFYSNRTRTVVVKNRQWPSRFTNSWL